MLIGDDKAESKYSIRNGCFSLFSYLVCPLATPIFVSLPLSLSLLPRTPEQRPPPPLPPSSPHLYSIYPQHSLSIFISINSNP
ncbi:hypothetical protein RJT34_17811 [Clitoria ternatea]|uniref:Uncharacterized protein n=1 Tax=Clitoria ternatea TaxID=43366 RepID=A0AAN9J9N0_CLITE